MKRIYAIYGHLKVFVAFDRVGLTLTMTGISPCGQPGKKKSQQ
jgi:hypothetical protein